MTPCKVHHSDGKITETIIAPSGWPHDRTHCTRCGIAMIQPVSHMTTDAKLRQVLLEVIDDGCNCITVNHPWQLYDTNDEEDVAAEQRVRFCDVVIKKLDGEGDSK